MPLVNVLVNGRSYNVTCDDGEEGHLQELADHLDNRVRELAGNVGQVGDARLLVMAGLLISDDLSHVLTRLEEQDRLIAELRHTNAALAEAVDRAEFEAAEMLDRAAVTIQTIADRLAES